MISLILDTSSSQLLVTICREQIILASTKKENIVTLSTEVLPCIKECLKKSDLSISSIDTIFIVNGPGSFTGLRVGVTIAKVMAYCLHKKIVPISSLELMATTPFEADYIVPYIDARRGYVYAGVYDDSLNCYMKDSYIKIEDLKNALPIQKKVVFTATKILPSMENTIMPNVQVLKIIEKHRQEIGVNPHLLNPNYLKLTEAEEKKRAEV